MRDQDKELVAKKKKLHAEIMSGDNKELDPLTHATFKTILDGLKIKAEKIYRHIDREGKHIKMQCSNTMNHH